MFWPSVSTSGLASDLDALGMTFPGRPGQAWASWATPWPPASCHHPHLEDEEMMGQRAALSHPGVQHTQATSPTRKPGEGAGLPLRGATAPHQWQQMHCGPSSVTVRQGQARHTSTPALAHGKTCPPHQPCGHQPPWRPNQGHLGTHSPQPQCQGVPGPDRADPMPLGSPGHPSSNPGKGWICVRAGATRWGHL